jgi:choline dehydrogenase-like flavoprotein
MAQSYDVVCIGSGFGSSFFLQQYLRHAPETARILVLERGPALSHPQRIARRDELKYESFQHTFVNETPTKPWIFTLGHGGSSNCWTGNTPRMLPNDFRLRTRYGVGFDWPISYDDLEPYYCEVEETFGVAGPEDTVYPRSRPYPCPPHQMSDPDRAMAAAYPGLFFSLPVAKPTRSRPPGRPQCCSSMSCKLCPIDSKFTILNGMRTEYADPRVELRANATAERIEHAAGIAKGVHYTAEGAELFAKAELVVLGANAIFNPHILLRSGLDGPWVGRGLCEQVSVLCTVELDGMDGFQGSTTQTALGYMLYDGPHRRERAAAMFESYNIPSLRNLRGRWRQRYVIRFVFEDLPQESNRVRLDADDSSRPVTEYHGHSEYTRRGLEAVRASLQELLEPLPVASFAMKDEVEQTEYHIQCTTMMGSNPEDSVVDANCRHHRVRNLVVVGSSVFPSAAPANPTLTLSALALRSARSLFGGQAI